ncbi:betaine--homocysteine s-methyltransferase 1-like [Plakobranchus ocellatus]|uniref:Betaine--homocysteine s-methyltransferase 1-like n=1 Tax=Plakobranchus ocellatus TaxID=259542 RepID=A0AAV3YQK0_9GAST|nr:betaine--homocysteine s-methyltransferase 1-like [Plakobranchus ocellatus]
MLWSKQVLQIVSLVYRKHGRTQSTLSGTAMESLLVREKDTFVLHQPGLRERLRDGESVICAEGYMWELERRGFVRAGVFTPEVVIDYPERVISLHEEYVHAGSDVVEAYTYYGHRQKLKVIDREDDLEALNLNSLKMARDVADKHGKLMAGNLSNTTTFQPNDPETAEIARQAFKEQVEWAVKGGADYMIAETFNDLQEAIIALDVIKTYGKGMPAVVTLVIYSPDRTTDDVPVPEALRRLEELGADCVGLNCGRGPDTMLPLLREARKVCKGPLAALPVPFRTNQKQKTFQSLTDPISAQPSAPYRLQQTATLGPISPATGRNPRPHIARNRPQPSAPYRLQQSAIASSANRLAGKTKKCTGKKNKMFCHRAEALWLQYKLKEMLNIIFADRSGMSQAMRGRGLNFRAEFPTRLQWAYDHPKQNMEFNFSNSASLYPLDLECVQCSRRDIRRFAQEARDIGVQYLGLCCGSSSHALREVAEVLGRKPPASAYSPDIGKSFVMGKDVKGHAKKIREYMIGDTKITEQD